MKATGTTIGPYEIVAPLGAGGMGEVYRAKDKRLGREVAVKILPPHLANDAEALVRFEREAKTVAALAHPSIVVLYDFGSEKGASFAVTELLEGETLRQRLGQGALPWRKAIEWSIAIAEGLAAAHGKGIVHRDMKPENLFLTADGRVKILDFGLARTAAAADLTAETQSFSPAHTLPGAVMGTVGYMSPEQVRGQTADARSDIFSLGCVLFEMVSGRRAFAGDSSADVSAAILNQNPSELTGSGRKVLPELERVILHCLEKRPEERFQSARDLAFALRALFSDSDHSAIARSGKGRVKTPARRSRKAIDSIAVLPLANASPDPGAEFLSDGITENIINSLSQLPKLRVMARSTVFRYKGKEQDPLQVGADLGVRAVLTGRLFQLNNNLVIAAELVDAADGAQLWGAQYKRKLADLIEVQEEIAQEIAGQLRLVLTGEEKQRLGKRATQNSEAFQLYLQGRFSCNKRTAEAVDKSIALFEAAIAKDPDYALAYAGLADSYVFLQWYGGRPPREVIPKGKAAALKALALDDALAEPHASLGLIHEEFDW
ncbi:MAG: serine/threonine-protein kinase, partial [Gemmataceae bacterium]|nr:serine/threonine-protein kinase [Gemmataceae bacterium]